MHLKINFRSLLEELPSRLTRTCLLALSLAVPLVSAAAVTPDTHVKSSADQKSVSVSFENADLSTVVRTFSEMLGRNIVIVDGHEKRVSVSLKDVDPFVALRTIVRSKDLALIERDGIFYIQGYNSLSSGH